MSQGPDSDARPDSDWRWPLVGAGLSRPRATESKTLTALLILFLLAGDKDEKALPASERILTLVSELQQNSTEGVADAERRAAVITQLSAAISGLRRNLD